MTEQSLQFIDTHTLKAWVHDNDELALLDVREHGQYGEGHLFFAVPLPYSVLELEVERLIPRKQTRIVVYGDDASAKAVQSSVNKLLGLDYTTVYMLGGGIEAWQADGYSTFAGVNLPSKTFGELAEHAYATPSISADDLFKKLNNKDENIIVLDGRPIQEYRKMNIPGAVCCPNGELALRIAELAPDPETTVVINCAGRTRSIIGAQTLINLNVPNKVYALENGTQGWYLADYPLEHGSDHIYPEQVDTQSLPALRERAAALAQRFAIPSATASQVQTWLSEGKRNVFLCDVRTKEEFLHDHLPGIVQHTPGGQLIQATDQYIGVRKACIVLFDPDGIRAPVVASWLKQLGWDVCLIQDLTGLHHGPAATASGVASKPEQTVAPEDLATFVSDHPAVCILDARPSQEFQKLSLAHSTWVIRPSLLHQVRCGTRDTVLILGQRRGKLDLIAQDLEHEGFANVFVSVVDTHFLENSGLPLRVNDTTLSNAECIDYLFFVHDRHDGNKEAARKYLEWETNLVPQLDKQERDTFSPGN